MGATFSRLRSTLNISGLLAMIPSIGDAAVAVQEPAVFGFKLEHLFGASDDQLQHVDVNGLLVEVISAERDGPQRVFASFVTGGDDDFGRRCNREDFGQDRQPLGGSVGIGRKPKIDDSHRYGILSDEIGGFLARAGGIHFVVRKGPAQLAQKTRIVIDDQQRSCGRSTSRHVTAEGAAGSLSGTRGRRIRMIVPAPLSEMTSRSPPDMRISSRV